MKAAWDWHLPRETAAAERALVEFAAELGFDTLVVHHPSDVMARRGAEIGVRLVAIVTPGVGETGSVPADWLQRVTPAEDAFVHAARAERERYQRLAHQWFPLVLDGDLLCLAQEDARREIEGRVRSALEVAGGVAFDGLGYRNQYACWCDRCVGRRAAMAATDPDAGEADILLRDSRRTLVETSLLLYECAKSVNPQAVVMNHLWPPFRPDWYYGHLLRLDYCSQTISWFYPPHWSMERVEFEAAEHKRLEDRRTSTFVPFIGLFVDPGLLRSPERLAAELDVAARYGDGNVVFCSLDAPRRYPEIAAVLRDALAGRATT